MRTLLLVLLAGGLIWLFFRPTPESEVQAGSGAVPAGVMLAPEGAADVTPQSSSTSDAPAEPARSARHEPAPAAGEEGAMPPARAVNGDLDPRSVSTSPRVEEPKVASSKAGDVETELGALLVHAPERVEARVAELGSQLRPMRALLARALCARARGDAELALKLAQGLDAEGAVTTDELEFLRRASSPGAAMPAASSAAGPLLRGARIAVLAREAELHAQGGKFRLAALLLTEAVLSELDSPWDADATTLEAWDRLLSRISSDSRWKRDGDWPSLEVTVQKGESLIAIRKRVLAEHPELLLCTGMIERANQLRGDVVHPGEKLRIPTERVSLLVDLSAHWAFYLMGDEIVAAWPVGVGRQGKETEPGGYRVGDKRKDPMWFPPGQEPVPFGDPRNPLGSRWIELEYPDGRASHLGFHGTNEPESVGKDASQGCLRMRQPDVEELFEIVPVGTPVRIQA